jgi:response regulator RpfG family c-di-GMP phosphodiesterase
MSAETLARVLFVDDEPLVLDALSRTLRGEFDVVVAVGAAAGLEALSRHDDLTVVVSDYAMPQMNGAQFLAAARAARPDASRILLTGQADLQGTAAVINGGGIHRLLLKPTEREDLVAAVRSGVEQHRLVTAERDLLDNTLRGSVRALTEVLALTNPGIFARSVRVRDLVRAISLETGHEPPWHLELAAMLSDIGAIAVPADVMERVHDGGELGVEEAAMVARLPQVADEVLAGIPRIGEVRDAILGQAAHWDGSAGSDPRAGTAIPLGGRLLALAGAYDALESTGATPGRAIATLRARRGVYDPDLLEALGTVSQGRALRQPKPVALTELVTGMVLSEAVLTADGMKLVAMGTELSATHLTRIRNFTDSGRGVREPVLVYGA